MKAIAIGRISFRSLPWLEESAAFRTVVADYLVLSAPPYFVGVMAPDATFTDQEALHAVGIFAWNLCQLEQRVVAARSGDGVEWERRWEKIRSERTRDQKRLAGILREAASLGAPMLRNPGQYSSLDGYKAVEITQGITHVDRISWPGSDNLLRWADVVDQSPVEVVFPDARPQPSSRRFSPHSIGRSGGKSKGWSALRAMVVREIAQHVPTSMRSHGGDSSIAELSSRLLSEPIIRQYVTSALKQRA